MLLPFCCCSSATLNKDDETLVAAVRPDWIADADWDSSEDESCGAVVKPDSTRCDLAASDRATRLHHTNERLPPVNIAQTPALPSVSHAYDFESTPMGCGFYGRVTAARHRRTGVRRAIKQIEKAKLKAYVTDVEAFVSREADVMRHLDHPNVVRLFDVFDEPDRLCIVMELLEGGDVLDLVGPSRARLPEADAATIFAQMLRAVEHLSLKGIVHRDLKPDNFMFHCVQQAGAPLPTQQRPVKLIDFGLSKRLTLSDHPMTPRIGTTTYMAPEVNNGLIQAEHADRLDMWSLGIVLHVILTGCFPLPLLQENPEKYFALHNWQQVSPEGRDLVVQLLQKDASLRPSATAALQHSWLSQANHEVPDCFPSVLLSFPSSVRSFLACAEIKQLALTTLAREVDDQDSHVIKVLFLLVVQECGGLIVKSRLQKVAQCSGLLGSVAESLLTVLGESHFDDFGWTKFLAIALSGMRLSNQSIIHIHDKHVWSAFDVLAQGEDTIFDQTLDRMLFGTASRRFIHEPANKASLCDSHAFGRLDKWDFCRMVCADDMSSSL